MRWPWGEWYNGYRFAKGAVTNLHNTDMVLYYLIESIPNKPAPDDLIDTNVRIDYGKLRHLLTVNRQLKATSICCATSSAPAGWTVRSPAASRWSN